MSCGYVSDEVFCYKGLSISRYGRRLPTCFFHLATGIPLGALAFIPYKCPCDNQSILLALPSAVNIKIFFVITVCFKIVTVPHIKYCLKGDQG